MMIFKIAQAIIYLCFSIFFSFPEDVSDQVLRNALGCRPTVCLVNNRS